MVHTNVKMEYTSSCRLKMYLRLRFPAKTKYPREVTHRSPLVEDLRPHPSPPDNLRPQRGRTSSLRVHSTPLNHLQSIRAVRSRTRTRERKLKLAPLHTIKIASYVLTVNTLTKFVPKCHSANCHHSRQQLLSDPGFGHLQL